MLSLNLLPWRLEQHQKAFWRFMWQGLIWLACSILIVVGLSHLNEQQAQTLNQTKEKTCASHQSSPSETHSKFNNYKVT